MEKAHVRRRQELRIHHQMNGIALTEKGEQMMIDREKAIRILEKCAKEPLRRNADKYVVTLDVRFVNSILELLKEQEERIKLLEHQLETLTKWRMNAGAFD